MKGSRRVVVMIAAAVGLSGCSAPDPAEDGTLRIVATTPIIADIARQVAGPNAEVTSIVPPGADPHSYEPSLRDARNLAYADLALSNHLLLEEQRVMRTVAATLPESSDYVELSEEAEKHGAELLPVVENQVLDQLWLGARVEGSLHSSAPRAHASPVKNRPRIEDAVTLRLLRAEGPGDAFGYITGTFGAIERVFDSTSSAHGLDLPPQSHTHLSWAFTRPGEYRLTFAGFSGEERLTPDSTVTVVVGGDPAHDPRYAGRKALSAGHTDLTLNLTEGRIELSSEATARRFDKAAPENAVIHVQSKALSTVPAESRYRFLGQPDASVYLLPQAVLGKHVHGSTDPHVWLDAANVIAWTERIKDALIARDPADAQGYRQRAGDLTQRLTALDADLKRTLAQIPPARRQLVTSHDSFAYFARAYRMTVAGFAVPATGAEPGPQERARLAATLRDLRVPAVFAQPSDGSEGKVLRNVAEEAGVTVCTLRSDTLDRPGQRPAGNDDAASAPGTITDYESLMRANAAELTRCLGEKP